MIQPLDVYFNRQYKMIGRKLYEYVRLHSIDINLAQRNNIIKMNSLIHNQLSSKEFNTMIKYAWYKPGYLTAYPGNFRDVNLLVTDNFLRSVETGIKIKTSLSLAFCSRQSAVYMCQILLIIKHG